ncbi:MAG: hypothetical protein U0793_33615 [Gemmataceae bacterium]
MTRQKLFLQPSEGIIVTAAATIYAGYVTAGRVEAGKERDWMRRSIDEAYWMARSMEHSAHAEWPVVDQ